MLKTTIMAALTSLAVCGATGGSPYPQDSFRADNGKEFSIRFFAHSSLAIEYDGKWLYFDPVGGNADYASLPAADYIFITHDHYDHLDTAAVAALSAPQTEIVCNEVSAVALGRGRVMRNGDRLQLAEDMSVEAVPAYNFTAGHENFHPATGRDNGYLLTLGGTRIYIAGDSENTPEMMALRDIDIAFLPVNQPYTMTVDQAAEAVKAIRPAIFYPYHYGQVEEKTDIGRLVELLDGVTQVRIRPME